MDVIAQAVAGTPTEEPVNRDAKHFTCEIPEGLVDATERRTGHRPPAEEEAAITLLPEEFDAGRVRADEPVLQIVEQAQHRPRR